MDVQFKTPPMDHQVRAIDFAVRECKGRAGLYLDIGTGKTLAAIYAAVMLDAERILVVCPASVVRTWREQIVTHTTARYIDISGTDEYGQAIDREVRILKSRCGERAFYITNFEGLKVFFAKKSKAAKGPRHVIDPLQKVQFDTIIIDESHVLGDPDSLQTRICMLLGDRVRNCLLLTGTPGSDIRKLWAQFRVLDGGTSLGTNYYAFLYKYFKPVLIKIGARSIKDWKETETTRERIIQKIAPSVICISREDCVDLPELIEVERDVEPSAEQRRIIKSLLTNLKADLKTGTLTLKNVNTRSLRISQVIGGVVINDAGAVSKLHSPKLDDMLLCIQQSNGKSLVYHKFVEEGRLIEDFLRKNKVPFKSLRGEISDKDSQIEAFKSDPKIKVLVANYRSGEIGQNLQCANVIILYSIHGMSPTDYLQTIGRIHRAGQTEKCLVVKLIMRKTLDEARYKALAQGVDDSQATLDWIRDFSE